MGGKCSDITKPLEFCTECIPGPPGKDGAPGKDGVCPCECCLPGMRAVLGFLNGLSPQVTDIKLDTITKKSALTQAKITGFYPNPPNNADTGVLVKFSGKSGADNKDVVVCICDIELIESSSLIDASADHIPDGLASALGKTLPVPPACEKTCQEEFRKLLQSKVGTTDNGVKSIDSYQENIIENGTIRATGAGVAIIEKAGKGSAVNLCNVASVQF